MPCGALRPFSRWVLELAPALTPGSAMPPPLCLRGLSMAPRRSYPAGRWSCSGSSCSPSPSGPRLDPRSHPRHPATGGPLRAARGRPDAPLSALPQPAPSAAIHPSAAQGRLNDAVVYVVVVSRLHPTIIPQPNDDHLNPPISGHLDDAAEVYTPTHKKARTVPPSTPSSPPAPEAGSSRSSPSASTTPRSTNTQRGHDAPPARRAARLSSGLLGSGPVSRGRRRRAQPTAGRKAS